MGLVDYHTHTSRCGHATGTLEQYVQQALRLALSEIGISDHAPLPDHLRDGITMAPADVEPYLSDLAAIRLLHQDTIAIRTGFEVDFPVHPTFDMSLLADPRIDYLIGSCHFLDEWAFDHPDHVDESAAGTSTAYTPRIIRYSGIWLIQACSRSWDIWIW